MICTSIQNKTLEEIYAILESGTVEMAEIRLDLCPLDEEEVEELFSVSDVPLVATCRIAGMAAQDDTDNLLEGAGKELAAEGLYPSGAPRKGRSRAEEQAEALLLKAVEAGAKYVDLEVEAPPAMGRKIRQACREYGSVLIRSCHFFDGTPPTATLLSMLERCRQFGGEVVKIVTMAESPRDGEAVKALYREADPGTLVAFCMGEMGRETRLKALEWGAPFTYAALSEDEATAPGQWTAAEMRETVYGSFRPFGGGKALRMPASKSFAQRAIVAAALAEGTSHLSGYSPCGDNEAALAVARALGAAVKQEGNLLSIKGIGAQPGCIDLPELHTGESGFLTRMIIPLLSVIARKPVRVTGEKTLLKRPLAGAHDIMASFGVRLYGEGPLEARKEDCFVPLKVAGPLIPGRADISGRGGSQLISGLLSALPLADGKSVVYVDEPRSIPYMFITVDVLKKFDIRIGSEMEGGDDFLQTQDWSLCTGVTFRMKGGQRYRAADFAIEGDWSSAAPFLVAGAIFGDVMVEGLDTRSLQADISIMDILMDAGASLSQLDGDTPSTGPVHVVRAPLNAFDTDLNNCPDLFPVVAVLAAFCPGTSHILGVERLRHKETDRAAAIAQTLGRMGVKAEVDGDEMRIEGMPLSRRLLTGNLLRGGSYSSFGDHRMVMALKVASLGADGPVDIDDTACVAKSFPAFNDLFNQL